MTRQTTIASELVLNCLLPWIKMQENETENYNKLYNSIDSDIALNTHRILCDTLCKQSKINYAIKTDITYHIADNELNPPQNNYHLFCIIADMYNNSGVNLIDWFLDKTPSFSEVIISQETNLRYIQRQLNTFMHKQALEPAKQRLFGGPSFFPGYGFSAEKTQQTLTPT